MKRKVIVGIIILLIVSLVVIVLIPKYRAYKERKRIENATVIVEFIDNLDVPFNTDCNVSDFISNINGELVNDKKIDTMTLGQKKVSFKYLNDENILIPYSFEINVIDNVAPEIWLNSSKSIAVGTSYEDFMEKITCADDLDDNPKCEIIGDYDLNKVGKYELTYKAVDHYNNETVKKFVLNVYRPSSNGSSSSTVRQGWNIKDIINDYKTANTKVGIDVSSWQGDIDFKKVKDAGVEFAFIRIGSTKGINAEYFVDKKFVNNIKGFNEVGIPVGVYFYSYSNSKESAISDAKWVLEQLEGYKAELGVAYDWENWSFYNNFHQSFYSTSMNAKAFLDVIAKKGYKGFLYSSKHYLENVWYELEDYDVWLAHYTSKTTYTGKYKYWQLCSNGKIDGINGFVDVDIMYN